MSTQLEEPDSQAKVGTLLGGIMQDARQLMVQQLTLFRVEITNEAHRVVNACIPLIAGVVVGLVALFILAMASVYFLCHVVPELPLWGGFAIVGGVIALLAVGLIAWGRSILKTVSPLPDKSMEGLKENLQWKTKT